MLNTEIRPDAPPMFMAMTADDPISNCNTSLYERWREAKRPVEMHIYANGGHGYGMRQQNKDSDSWTSNLEDWLTINGYTMYGNMGRNFPLRFIVNAKRNIPDKVTGDWAEIKRYQESNRNTTPKAKGEKRVVFMGNSITDYWINSDSAFFAENNFIDRGISGQQTDQMLVRFKPDVLDLSPSVVVILAGTNDLHAEKPAKWIMDNIISMVQLAKANKITPVLCSVTPVRSYFIKPYINAVERINELNRMIQEYAISNKIIYVDYYTSMSDEKGGMKAEYTRDGVHPNLNGYKIMEPIVLEAIKKALGK
jgi:lysophospholipase L1-like esterase